jgi:hypothetical protein
VIRVCVLLLAVWSAAQARAQPQSSAQEHEFFEMTGGTRPLALAHGYADPASFRLLVAGETWQEGRDYRLRAREGVVIPLRTWTEPGGAPVLVMAVYSFTPVALTPRLNLHPIGRAPVPGGGPTPGSDATTAESFGAGFGDLNVRGSKSVHVASGNRRELTVDQNLRLTMEGQLTRDIAVRALLTDDNLPVVPEGNTEELQDIDNVLVELTASRWRATLGDFVGLRQGTVYGNYRRKLQGFSVLATPGPGFVEVLTGSPRGRYRTIEIRGQETNQGPYFLGGGSSSASLFIVAGSERVTLDGATLTRGEDRDYVIDYVRGTVTFTYRRLITAQSLVLVEFEEGEGPYARSALGGGGGVRGRLLGAPATFGVRMVRERDDAGRLRTGELAPEDEAVLAAAGDDPGAALASGATQVEPGAGDYRQEDQGGALVFVYDAQGDWAVSFAYLGSGLGDYDLDTLTEGGARVFVYRGPGLGSYGPGRLLPLPQSHSLTTLAVTVGDSLAAGVDAEWNLSRRDMNVLSTLDDSDNSGEAGRVRLRSGELPVAGGGLSLRGGLNERGGFFAPMLTDRTTFEYEAWGLGDRARRDGFLQERDRVVDGVVVWARADTGVALRLEAAAAKLDHGTSLGAERWQVGGDWRWRHFAGRSIVRGAAASDDVDLLDISRRDQDHDLAWTVGPVVPRVTYHTEEWSDAAASGSAARGFRFERRGAGIGAVPGRPWRWDVAFERDFADSLQVEGWRRDRNSDTWRGRIGTPRLGGVRATGEATVRAVTRPGGPDETARLGRLDLAGEWPVIGSDWSLSYGVDNSRAEVLRRQIVYAGENQGNYNEAGDFVGVEQGAYDVVLAGTDSLVATTAVQADLSWRQNLRTLGSSVTRLSMQSRSRTDDIGGLLRLDPAVLFDPLTVVLANLHVSEELDLLRNVQAWDMRVAWNLDETRDRQYVASQEDRLRRRYQGTLTWNATNRTSLRLRATHEGDRRTTDAVQSASRQSYDVLNRRLELEGALRPVPGDRLAIAVEAGRRTDDASGIVQDELAVAPSVRWRPRAAWTVQTDLRLAEVTSDEPAGSRRPYFFPRPGRNIDATARLGWNPNEYLTFALVYTGRRQGDLEWQHELRLESSARF